MLTQAYANTQESQLESQKEKECSKQWQVYIMLKIKGAGWNELCYLKQRALITCNINQQSTLRYEL